MIRIVKKDISFNFVEKYKTLGLISLAVVLISAVMVFFVFGMNFGIDFKGGTNILYQFEKTPSTKIIRDILKKQKISGIVNTVGENEVSVQISKTISLISNSEVERMKSFISEKFKAKGLKKIRRYQEGSNRLRVIFDKSQNSNAILATLKKEGFQIDNVKTFGVDESSNSKLNSHQYDIEFVQLSTYILNKMKAKIAGKITVNSLEQVGPKVGDKLKQDGTLAMIYALFAILVYIAFRFDTRFSPGAVVALVHDVMITLGIFAVFKIEFNLPVIAAILTLIGYSLNDTIVIFDKIREVSENNKMNKKNPLTLSEVVNKALNSTLSRTLLTSLTTLGVVVAMLIFGGASLFPFSIALLVGVVIGTYSSLFIASPVYIFLEKRNQMKVEKFEMNNVES